MVGGSEPPTELGDRNATWFVFFCCCRRRAYTRLTTRATGRPPLEVVHSHQETTTASQIMAGSFDGPYGAAASSSHYASNSVPQDLGRGDDYVTMHDLAFFLVAERDSSGLECPPPDEPA